jgi:hypothetical protein
MVIRKQLDIHRWINGVLLVLWVLFLGLLVAIGAEAAQKAAPAISVKPSSGLAGSKVTINGSGFTWVAGGSDAQILWDEKLQSTFPMPKNGAFSIPFTIPKSAAPGDHIIRVCNQCGGEFEETARVGFKVSASPTDTPKPPTETPTRVPPTDTPTSQSATETPTSQSATDTPTLTPTNTQAPAERVTENGCSGLDLGPDAVVVNFDDLSPGSFPNNTLVADFGVGFERSLQVTIPENDAHSPDYAAKSLDTYEFGGSVNLPIRFAFPRGAQAVGMYLGLDSVEGVTGAVTATLRAWGYRGVLSGVELGASSLTFPFVPSDIEHCIEFQAAEGEIITRAILEYTDETGASLFPYRLIDDLTILPPLSPLPPDESPPVIEITSPVEGVTISEPSAIVRADIFEDRELSEVWLAVNTSGTDRIGFSTSSEDPTHYTAGLTTGVLIPYAENTITMWAVDASGLEGRDSVTFTYDPPTPVPELDILPYKYELTQAIQCMETPVNLPYCGADNSIPQYVDKATLLRLYVYATGTAVDVPNISAQLCLDSLSNCIRAFNVVRVAPWETVSSLDNPVRMFRGDLDRTLNFMIPADWQSTDEHTFILRINPDGENAPERDLTNNDLSFGFRFRSSRRLDMVLIPVQADCGGFQCAPNLLRDGGTALSYFEQVYPTGNIHLWTIGANINLLADYDYTDTSGSGCGDGWGELLDDLWWYNAWNDDPVDYLRYYGMVDELVAHKAHGCGYTPGDEAGGIVRTEDVHNVDFAGAIMAQEIGHNHGRNHAPGCYAGNPDGSYPALPNTDPAAAEDDLIRPYIGEWGIDLRTMTLFEPQNAHDFMGYCTTNIWVGPYTYRALGSAIHDVAERPSSGGLMSRIPPAQVEPLYLVGSVLATADSAEVRRGFFVLPASDEMVQHALTDEGHYVVELLDSNGQVLLAQRLNPEQLSNHSNQTTELLHIIMPWREGASFIAISRENEVLTTFPVSPNPPTVQLLSPNGGESLPSEGMETIEWEGSDPDGDLLQYTLQYSVDNGQHWIPLAIDPQATSVEVNLAEIAGSEEARIRIVASDGVNTAFDESDSTFSTARKPPRLVIVRPGEGDIYPSGEQIIFDSRAIDLEDGFLERSAYAWASNRDGALGQGRSIWGVPLSRGRHEITLTVTDRDGLSASATISILILGEEPGEEIIALPPTGDRSLSLPTWAVPVLIAFACFGVGIIVVLVILLFRERSKRIASLEGQLRSVRRSANPKQPQGSASREPDRTIRRRSPPDIKK